MMVHSIKGGGSYMTLVNSLSHQSDAKLWQIWHNCLEMLSRAAKYPFCVTLWVELRPCIIPSFPVMVCIPCEQLGTLSLWSRMLRNMETYPHFLFCHGESLFPFNWNFPHESVRVKSRFLINKPTNQITPWTSKPSPPLKKLSTNCKTPQTCPGTSEIEAKNPHTQKKSPSSLFSHHIKTLTEWLKHTHTRILV